MRGYRKRPGTQGFSVPLVGASLFFIISLFLFASYKNSAYQQAKKEIYSLYITHLTMWAENDEGLVNLMKASTDANLEGQIGRASCRERV